METGIWSEPHPHVLGEPVAIGRLVVRSEHALVAVRSLEASARGCGFLVKAVARRGSLPQEVWAGILGEFGPPGPDGLPVRSDLRLGVDVPGGYRGRTFETGGSAGTDGETYDAERLVWLSPLPPPGPFEFTVEWPSLGLERTALTLDGAAVRRAAERAEPYWP
ncbi:hypothetical protein ACWCYY_30090 [Kitasatospora sp. NPDC001664]